MQVDLPTSIGVVGRPDATVVEQANPTRFLQALGVDGFESLNERASRYPTWFHDELIRFLDHRFERPCERVLASARDCLSRAGASAASPAW